MCGHNFGRKSKQGMPDGHDQPKPNASQPVPLYEPVLLNAVEHQDHGLELKDNVAYCPSKL